MAKFISNNTKNASTNRMPFELNCRYYLHIFFEDDINSYSISCSIEELAKKLIDLIFICQLNSLYTQNLQKQAYHKTVKPESYTSSENIWLNSKYIKIKQN